MANSDKKLILEIPQEDSSVEKLEVKLRDSEYELFFKKNETAEGGKELINSQYLEKSPNGTLAVKSDFFSEDKQVKDKYRYDLAWDSDNSQWKLMKPCGQELPEKITKDNISECDQDITDELLKDTTKQNILIILESPHKDEFSPDYKPLQPAKGATGEKFYKYFESQVLTELFALGLVLCSKKVYRIFFVNPVQNQASLVYLHGDSLNSSLTKKVWRKLYNKNGFKSRLGTYQPVVIINSCTSGVNKNVWTALKKIHKVDTSIQVFQTLHPSVWGKIASEEYILPSP